MHQIREIQLENKVLRRQLDKTTRRLFDDMCFYVRFFDLTNHQYHSISNKVLSDFNQRLVGNNVNSLMVDNPKQYIDKIIESYHTQKTNPFLRVIRRYAPYTVGVFSLYIIRADVIFPMSSIVDNSIYLSISISNLLRMVSTSLLLFIIILNYARNLFNPNKGILVYVMGFLLYAGFRMYAEGLDNSRSINFVIPLFAPYITLGLSVWIKWVDRKSIGL